MKQSLNVMNLFGLREREVIWVSGVATKTTAVDGIMRHIKDCLSRLPHVVLNNRQAVILQVLVTDSVLGGHAEHRRHVGHFKNPYSLWVQNALNILGELSWAFQVIEHSNRGYDVALLPLQALC